MFKKWVYDLTIHNAVEVMASSAEDSNWESKEAEADVIACDTEGQCFYHEVLRPDVRPFVNLLNRRGAEGWELVQHSFHSGHLYLVWRREAEE